MGRYPIVQNDPTQTGASGERGRILDPGIIPVGSHGMALPLVSARVTGLSKPHSAGFRTFFHRKGAIACIIVSVSSYWIRI